MIPVSTRRARGFTLVELMVVVAIIGVLASVALPSLSRATLRARSAERGLVVETLKKHVEDLYTRDALASGEVLAGPANPPGALGTSKREWNPVLGQWARIVDPGSLEGALYYQYAVDVSNGTGAGGAGGTFTILADGDLDGDGVDSTKMLRYARYDGYFALVVEEPRTGSENEITF